MTEELREALRNLCDAIQKECPHAVKATVVFEGGRIRIKLDEYIVCTTLEINS